MKTARNTKKALLAVLSLTAAAGAMAASADAHAQPSAVAIEAPIAVSHAADEMVQSKSVAVKLGVAGALTATLAGLVKLVGVGRLAGWFRQAAPVMKKAAKAVVRAPVEAAKVVGRTVASPVRFTLLLGGLGLFALTGVGLYDLEWIGGLIVGAALVITVWTGAHRTKRILQPRPVRTSEKQSNG